APVADERDDAAGRWTVLEVDLVRLAERLRHDDVEARALACLPEGDAVAEKRAGPGLDRHRRQLLDALDCHATAVEDLKDRRAGLRHGEGGANRHGEDGERDHERSPREKALARRDLAGAAEDAPLEVGLRRPVSRAV